VPSSLKHVSSSRQLIMRLIKASSSHDTLTRMRVGRQFAGAFAAAMLWTLTGCSDLLEPEPRDDGPFEFQVVQGPLTGANLHDVWNSGSSWVVVGDYGTVLVSSNDGVSWARHATPSNYLSAVWGEGSTVVAVGSGGTILRSSSTGTSWQAVGSGTSQALRGVSGAGSTVVAVGSGGTILRSTIRARPGRL
jgi:photosystem II stability/assembly factor-like uncharacterized protein